MAAAEPIELRAGESLGRYRIDGIVGRSTTGTVYRARDPTRDCDVAIKRMRGFGDSTRCEIEARLLSRLDHPHVVRVLEHFGGADGSYSIVMDLVEGTDLSRVLWDRGAPGLPLHEVVQLAREACEALQYLHDQQVVHGDVKPQNLIRGMNGVVLVDFGAAAALDARHGGVATAGTPRFMAPEVFAGGAITPRSDVFSLAATVWNLLTGSLPVYGDETSLSDTVAGVTPDFEAALREALEVVPAKRLPSAAALAKVLGTPLGERRGASLALSLAGEDVDRQLVEAIVGAAAAMFEAAAASIAMLDPGSGDLVYRAAWGAGADEIVGVRLRPDVGIAGAVVRTGVAQAVPDCRSDDRFASQVASGTGYVPHTMLVTPLLRDGRTIGALSWLDRRDGRPYEPDDTGRAAVFAELSVVALGIERSGARARAS